MDAPTVRPFEQADAERLLAFFDRKDQGFCYCRFWDFPGTDHEWLETKGPENRGEAMAALAARRTHGLLALEGDAVVGWLRYERTLDVPKLLARGYEPLPPPPDRASILCVSVASDRRGAGIAAALLDATLAHLEGAGFTQVDAYPRTEREGLSPGAVWTGPRGLFEARGFTRVVAEQGKRVTLRRVFD